MKFALDFLTFALSVGLVIALGIVFGPALVEIGKWLELQVCYLTGSRKK